MINSIDQGLNIIGDNNKYQLTVAILLFLMGICADLIYSGMPLMETSPIVDITIHGKIIHSQLNYSLCHSNYTINEHSKNDWVYDYNIYCNKFLVSLIATIITVGGVVGAVLLQIIKSRGSKYSLILMCLIMYTSVILLSFRNLFFLYLFILINGMSSLGVFMLKINISTEIANKEVRSFYNNFIISGGTVSLMLIYYLFFLDINWKFVYFINSMVLFLLTIVFYLVYVESPRFYFAQSKFPEMIHNMVYIARYNNRTHSPHFKENFDNFVKNIKGDTNSLEKQIDTSTKDEFATTRSSSHHMSHTLLNKSLLVNFIISYSLMSFVFIIYMMEIKDYSYSIEPLIFWFGLISILCIFFVSYLMNYFGRKKSKIFFLSLFLAIYTTTNLVKLGSTIEPLLYLLGRLVLHMVIMINHTHLNESFPSSIRIKIFGVTFTLAKLSGFFAPFVVEYLRAYNFLIIVSISFITIMAYALQVETSHRNLADIY